MSDATTSVYYDEEPLSDEPVVEEPPRRTRRRLVTPVTLALGAILAGGLGFIGGVKAQKQSEPSSTGAGGANAPGLATAQRGAPGGGDGATPTFGRVSSKNGNTLYVKDANGNTVKVKATSNSKVTRTASASVKSVHPGDTVIVQGSKSSNGTVTASSITATASNAARGGLGGAMLFGGPAGGGPPAGGGQSGGGGGPRDTFVAPAG